MEMHPTLYFNWLMPPYSEILRDNALKLLTLLSDSIEN
jgi:hypothetical protein